MPVGLRAILLCSQRPQTGLVSGSARLPHPVCLLGSIWQCFRSPLSSPVQPVPPGHMVQTDPCCPRMPAAQVTSEEERKQLFEEHIEKLKVG